MPIWRRAWRRSAPDRRARSTPSNNISPAVGSTRRLMQRISVLLPVPEGPITALTPRSPNAMSMWRRIGLPRTYSLLRPRMTSAIIAPHATSLLRFGGGFRFFARGFLLVRRLVESLPRSARDLPHDFPRRLVIDREKSIGAVERLLHFRRETKLVEAREQFVGELRLEVVRVSERRRREFLAAIDDAEIGFLHLSAFGHPVKHVGCDRARVVVAGIDAHHRLVVLAREDDLVVLVRR